MKEENIVTVEDIKEDEEDIKIESKVTKIDHLKEDKPLPGQNYVCISFVSPEGIRNTTIRGLKIRGVFEKLEYAQEHAEKLQKEDPSFHIYVGEMGKWLPWDPNPEDKSKVKDSKYYEEELQKIVEGYEKNRERASKAENDRKRELLQKSLQSAKKNQSNKGKLEQQKDILRKKVEDRKMNDNKQKVKSEEQIISDPELKEKEEKVALENERINKNEEQIKESENKLKSLDENLNKIKEIYNKMQQKKQQGAKGGQNSK